MLFKQLIDLKDDASVDDSECPEKHSEPPLLCKQENLSIAELIAQI